MAYVHPHAPGELASMPKIKPPQTVIEKLLRSTVAFDCGNAICGILLAGIGAARTFVASPDKDPHAWFFVTALIVGGVQGAFAVARAALVWFTSDNRDQIHSLEGCMHAIHALLMSTVKPDDPDPGLRLTVHIPCSKGKQLVQVLDYIGDGRAGKKTARRKFPVQCGIIGWACRNQKSYLASREKEDYEAFIQELVASWGYEEAEARKVHPATRSWFAFPLCDSTSKKTEAVVYADSKVPAFFDTEERQEILENGCRGIARFIELH